MLSLVNPLLVLPEQSSTMRRTGKQLSSRIARVLYKWKNHFSEMKGNVGVPHHEKEGEQEDAYTETGDH